MTTTTVTTGSNVDEARGSDRGHREDQDRRAQVASALSAWCLPSDVTELLLNVLPALAASPDPGPRPDPDACLDAIEAVHRMGAALDAARMVAVRGLAVCTGSELLGSWDAGSPEELSRTTRERWLTRTKSVTAAEVQTLTGLGVGEARQLVAVATAPPGVSEVVRRGLHAGVARWSVVQQFWRRCSLLEHEEAAQVASCLFGEDPATVAVERLDPDGAVSGRPWDRARLTHALEREVTRQQGRHPDRAARLRAEQHRSRTAYGVVDDDGSGQVVITGDAVRAAACVDRLHVLARRARQHGDGRTEAQLRSDIAAALLLHGTLPVPDLGDDPALVTPDGIEALGQVLSGAPARELQVVVPWDVLAGRPTNPAHPPPAHPPPKVPAPPVEGVGQLLGRFPCFLTGEAVRHLAAGPGTTLHRLLTDPADGRCLERSITGYAPDAQMRRQVRAADVTSRAPGSVIPVRDSDLDHVQEWLLGGPTAEVNLQGLDRRTHALKTEKHWSAVMDATRTVTWTTLFGRIYRTRAHDYRQYLAQVPHHVTDRPEPGTEGRDRTEERALASFLVYAALTARARGAVLAADSDDLDADAELDDGVHRAIWIRHRRPDGRTVSGPHRHTPTPEELVRRPAELVLQAERWTDAFAPAPTPAPVRRPRPVGPPPF